MPAPPTSMRTDHMLRVARWAAVITVLLFVAGCSSGAPTSLPIGLGSKPSTFASSASIAPGSTAGSFRSTRYRYSVVLPEGWSTNEPPGSGGVHPDEPGVDTFKNGGHIFYVTAEDTNGQPGTWTCAIVKHLEGPDHGLAVETTEPVMVDGVAARLSEFDLVIKPYRIHYLEVEVVEGTRGYALSLESTTGDDVGDRALLDQFVSGFRFEG